MQTWVAVYQSQVDEIEARLLAGAIARFEADAEITAAWRAAWLLRLQQDHESGVYDCHGELYDDICTRYVYAPFLEWRDRVWASQEEKNATRIAATLEMLQALHDGGCIDISGVNPSRDIQPNYDIVDGHLVDYEAGAIDAGRLCYISKKQTQDGLREFMRRAQNKSVCQYGF